MEIETIREGFKDMCNGVATVLHGVVIDVDMVERSCTIDDDGTIYYGVALQGVLDGDSGSVVFPRIGSVATAVIVADGLAAMVSCSECEKIEIRVDEISMEIDSSGVLINTGSRGGIVNIEPLKQWMTSVKTDLEAVAVALKAIAPVVITTQLPNESIEDKRIKH